MTHLKAALQALAAQAQANKIQRMSETQVQGDYVLKVLELLGWSISDRAVNEGQKVRTGKFPDIRLHDRNKHTVLVVECKDARKADKLDGRYGNKTFVEQLYGYCRAEGIYWGLLTNFVEWRLYNEPQGRLYQNKRYAFLDLLWPGANPKSYVDILSDEGLAFLMKFQRTPLCHAKGKVDDDPLYYPVEKQVEDIKAKFFVKLKGWRDSLRRELHKNYWEKYDKDQIDLFTQKILDRMIFIEVCHDKDIIGQDVHRAILSSRDDKYHELKKWFKEMDEQFNTELFAPMAIDQFDIDDKVLVPIIEELNEIDFKNVSVHIIGEVYENYLGEMLRVTKKSGLKVQEHKEQAKRKSQGIYYTPEYIVDYIVRNTVGELVKKAKAEDDLKKIKILDPACGSGSFLIKAFDVMYEAYEKLKIEKNKGQLETGKDLKIKRAILQHNLYGVDLDERAVEITKLNLMLKALEGFNYHELKGRKLLPNLNLNIRVGNSLISGQTIEQLAKKEAQTTIPGLDDVVDIKLLLKLHNAFYKEVEDEEKARLIKEIEVEERRLNRKLGDNLKGYFSNLDEIKPLNYQVAFPEVYKQGGFDAVIGNPPYVTEQLKDGERKYFAEKEEENVGKLNTYRLFTLRAVEIMKQAGLFGFIIPNTYLSNRDSIYLRETLLSKTAIREIIYFPESARLFGSVTQATTILLFEKGDNKKGLVKSKTALTKYELLNEPFLKIEQNKISDVPDKIFLVGLSKSNIELVTRLFANVKKMEDYLDIYQGEVNVSIYKESIKGTKDKSSYVPLIRGDDVNRYSVNMSLNNKKGSYVDSNVVTRNHFEQERIVTQEVSNMQQAVRVKASLLKQNYCCGHTTNYALLKDKNYSLELMMGILNSKLINWLFKALNNTNHLPAREIKRLPVPIIDLNNKKQKAITTDIAKLVKEMLKLNKIPELRQRHAADIAVIDREIDELVYRLYGLSEAEKKVVEGSK
jgi:Alw26I/Eco31I/Esp3I family type II restriction m6 adenine DNA methyltransferase